MIADVALPYPLSHPFSYRVPEKWRPYLFISQRVLVPFRERKVKGYIVDLKEGETSELKEIVEPIDFFPFMPPTLYALIEWMRDYFIIPHGILMKYALSDIMNIDDFLVIKSKNVPKLEGLTLRKAYSKYGKDLIFSLSSLGKIEFRDIFFELSFPMQSQNRNNKDYKRTLYIGPIEKRLEMYINEVESVIRRGENCLIFCPSYSLSGKLIHDFIKRYYPEKVLWFGQETKKKDRIKTYFTLAYFGGYIVLSNVMGLFLPANNLGLIIVERPEDESFIMNTRFSINVADCAMKRSELEFSNLLVGSIAPPLSFIHKKEFFSELKREVVPNFGIKTLPKKGADEISSLKVVTSIISEAIKKNQSVAVYIPRKHYSGKIVCMECNEVLSCDTCGSNLSSSKEKNSFFCPKCEETLKFRDRCSQCGSSFLALQALGVEFIKEFLICEFPSLNFHLVTSAEDLAIEGHQNPLVVIGTKNLSFLYGKSFENLVILNLKELKKIWKYKAYEKMYELIMNLVDSLKPNVIYFVGTKKDDIEIQYLLDTEKYYNEELKKRTELDFPPSKRLILMEIARKDKEKLDILRKKMEDYLQNQKLNGYIFGYNWQRKKKGYTLRIILKGLTEELTSKIFPLFDLYGVTVKTDPDTV
ncbi:MAG: hypothetical protein N2513_09930 [Deltaproteobacteria bacterium]|nr:hypothetical protein [Deltaproteobacteria bacterium]